MKISCIFFPSFLIEKSLYNFFDFQKSGEFYKRNPFKIHLDQFPPNIDTAFNFTKEIPLKLNRTKKKVYQKIELTFNFTKEIHVKIIRNKKNQPWNLVSKIPSRIVKLETIFEKSHRSSVILKIVGATPQLVQNLTPIRNLLCTFLYQCCCYPRPFTLMYLRLKKI